MSTLVVTPTLLINRAAVHPGREVSGVGGGHADALTALAGRADHRGEAAGLEEGWIARQVVRLVGLRAK